MTKIAQDRLKPHEMSPTPPKGYECDLKVGDIVNYTNEFDVMFENQEVVGFTLQKDILHGSVVYLKNGAYWFPIPADSLEKLPLKGASPE